MTVFISEAELEQLSIRELLARLRLVFNALARKPQAPEVTAQLLGAIVKIENAIQRRQLRPPRPE